MAPSKDASAWAPNTAKAGNEQSSSESTIVITDAAQALIDEHELTAKEVASIQCTGKDGKMVKGDVAAVIVAKEKAKEENEEELIPTLIFPQSGWCNELERSYRKGPYKPRNQKEYDALKPFAE